MSEALYRVACKISQALADFDIRGERATVVMTGAVDQCGKRIEIYVREDVETGQFVAQSHTPAMPERVGYRDFERHLAVLARVRGIACRDCWLQAEVDADDLPQAVRDMANTVAEACMLAADEARRKVPRTDIGHLIDALAEDEEYREVLRSRDIVESLRARARMTVPSMTACICVHGDDDAPAGQTDDDGSPEWLIREHMTARK